jgi:hypothetical protein
VDEPATEHSQPAHVWLRAGAELAALLADLPVGAPLAIHSGSEISTTLEYLVPRLLRRDHHEWSQESIDGFYFSHAVKTGSNSADLAGLCILISDQTLTPFQLSLSLSLEDTFDSFRIRLGEPGEGALGISGPDWSPETASSLPLTLDDRLDQIDWVYDLVVD